MLTPDLLLARPGGMPAGGVVHVAYSGGCDSTVLLHLAALARDQTADAAWSLRAIHVNHGLHPDAGNWEAHCRSVCEALAVPLDVARPDLDGQAGNLEARARSARYAVFRKLLGADDILMMAHHLEDQAETLLLALMRGRGPGALAGMPATRRLGHGALWRPLLNVPPQTLRDWAAQYQLRWVEDPSNNSFEQDRNYLRHRVLPQIRSRWPGYATGWQQSAGLIAEAEQAQRREARADLSWLAGEYMQRLPVAQLSEFEPPRRRNLVRHWLRALCRLSGDAPPDRQLLERLDGELLGAAPDAMPLLEWADSRWQLRRFRGWLYALLPVSPAGPPAALSAAQPLVLGDGLGTLRALQTSGVGVPARCLANLQVRFDEPGLTVRPAGRRSRSLKKLFQEHAVPPWLRSAVPLIYAGDELVAVGDLFLCEGWQVEEKEVYRFCWIRSELHCGY